MKRPELKQQHRKNLADNYRLRAAIASDIMAHERTIQRWAVNNNPKLCASHVLASFRKHAGIPKGEVITQEVVITQPHDLVA